MTTKRNRFYRLNKAVQLLLDSKYGEKRSARVRGLIDGSVKTTLTNPFPKKAVWELNVLYHLAKEDREFVLTLLQLADAQRAIAAHLADSSPLASGLKRRREYMRDRRYRYKLAVAIENHRRQTRMPPSQVEKFKAEKTAEWDKARRAFLDEHCELSSREASRLFAEQLTDKLEKEYVRLFSTPVPISFITENGTNQKHSEADDSDVDCEQS